jgi:hypothetical protein
MLDLVDHLAANGERQLDRALYPTLDVGHRRGRRRLAIERHHPQPHRLGRLLHELILVQPIDVGQ